MAFDNIKLEKGLYTTGKSFTAALEELDPSENYIGTSLEGLDAYERQLKRFDIKVSGPKSDTISKFFATTDSSALFPEYISRAVKSRVEIDSVVDDIVASVTEVEGMDYRSLKTDRRNDLSLPVVNEGLQLPDFNISISDSLTKLEKHGRVLSASYEAIKFQRLDIFTVVLKQIGDCILKDQFEQALNAIINENVHVESKTEEDITYDDLLDMWYRLSPYKLNRLVMGKGMVKKLLRIPELRDSNAGLDFHATGKIITPLGAQILVSESIGDEVIVAFDKNYAVEKVQSGGVLVEFDKLIDRQLERAAISTITGFSPIYYDAVTVLEMEE